MHKKGKRDAFYFIKMENFSSLKDTMKHVRRTATRRGTRVRNTSGSFTAPWEEEGEQLNFKMSERFEKMLRRS